MIFFNNKKVNKFGGNNRIYQGDWLIYQTYTGDILEPIEPSIDYTPIQYISNISGNSKNDISQIGFDFYVTITERTKFQIEYEIIYGDGGLFIGDTTSQFDDGKDLRLFHLGTSSLYFDVYSNRVSTSISNLGKNENGHIEIECGNSYIKSLVNDYVRERTPIESFTLGNLTLWHRYATLPNYDLTNVDGCRVFYLKIYDGDELIRDLIPVLDKDGIGCFFDKVNKNFYYKEGEGEVFLGEAI